MRFVNIVGAATADQRKLWKILESVRTTFLKSKSGDSCTKDLVSERIMQENFRSVKEALKIRSSECLSANMSNETLKIAAEMFLYLNFCPPKILTFYKHLFKHSPTRDIILAFSNIIHTSLNSYLTSSYKIWLKVADDFKLIKIVEDVQNIKDWKNSSFMENVDLDELYKVSNHPVHIFDEKGLLSPTALIPFCQLGNEFQGNTTDHFSVPVCRGFKAKIHNKKLCYEINPNFRKKDIDKRGKGLTLFLSFNKDRQMFYNKSWSKKDVTVNKNDEIKIIIGSIGK